MDIVKLEACIEALESELASPSPQHFNLTRLVALGLKEVSALLRYLHGLNAPQTTVTAVSTATVGPEVSATIEIPEPETITTKPETTITLEDATKIDDYSRGTIDVPVASPITENPISEVTLES